MKQQLIIPAPVTLNDNKKYPKTKPWIVIKSKRKGNETAYPPVIMPRESHGFIKAKRFDFL